MLRMTAIAVVSVVVGLAALVRPVAAAHNEPAKAKTMKGALVTAYEPCRLRQTTTTNGLPACLAGMRSNPTCGFGGKGTGALSATIKPGDVAFRLTLKGLDDGCDGRTLQLRVTLRATVEDCSGGSCTVLEVPKLALGSCVVDAGTNSCLIKTTMNTVRPTTFAPGKLFGIELIDADVFDPAANRPTFRVGLLVP